MPKSKRERVLEIWEDGFLKMSGGGGEVEKENGLRWGEEKPRYVEEGERESSRQHQPRRRTDGAALHHRDCGDGSH